MVDGLVAELYSRHGGGEKPDKDAYPAIPPWSKEKRRRDYDERRRKIIDLPKFANDKGGGPPDHDERRRKIIDLPKFANSERDRRGWGPGQSPGPGAGDGDRWGRGPDRWGPGPDRWGPGPDRWGPGPDRWGPGPDRWGPGPDRFGPPGRGGWDGPPRGGWDGPPDRDRLVVMIML